MPSRSGQVQFGSGQRNIDYSWKITCDVPKQTKLKESTDNALFLNTKLVFHKRMLCYFLHSVIFIDWMYCDRGGPKIPGCLSVSLCVYASVCVCVCSRQYAEITGPISMKLSKTDP